MLTTGYIYWGKQQLKNEVQAMSHLAETLVSTQAVSVKAVEKLDPVVAESILNDEPFNRRIDFAELNRLSPNVYGWIYQPGLNIDFYVMKEDYKDILNPYYIWRSITGDWSRTGSALTFTYPYSDDAMRIIYAHHFTTEEPVMFTEHTKFKDQGFAETYPYFYIYYEDRVERYRIWAPVNVTHDHDLYYMPHTKGSDTYKTLIDDLEQQAYFTLGEKPSEMSNLMILSSCDRLDGSWFSGGRMTLVGVPAAAYYYDTETIVTLSGPAYTFERSGVHESSETETTDRDGQ